MVVSTRNHGALTDLPYECVVEVSSIITGIGPRPLTFGKFKPAMRGMVQLMKAMEEVTIEAAVTGSYAKALQAFILNPLIPSGEIAKTILNEMLLAHKDYLPQFTKSIKEIEKNSSL